MHLTVVLSYFVHSKTHFFFLHNFGPTTSKMEVIENPIIQPPPPGRKVRELSNNDREKIIAPFFKWQTKLGFHQIDRRRISCTS